MSEPRLPAARIRPTRLDWVEPVKALALLWILWNHLVEHLGRGPWFTNPSETWPDLHTRLRSILPTGGGPLGAVFNFVGWLGDSGPGVFVVLSGLGLTLANLASGLDLRGFFSRRLGRLYPMYIAAHLVVLLGALAIPGDTLTLASPDTLLSLLGLRFRSDLFFSINPSWWYVWLTVQLYCAFPLLYVLLRRVGVPRFLLLCCGLTFAARAAGILWLPAPFRFLTGQFFVTRLAEFAVGMGMAAVLVRPQGLPLGRLDRLRHPAWLAAAVYPVGLLCSFTWPGAVVATLLVSVGLCGVLYGVAQALCRVPVLRAALTWIGIESYGIYLLHQAPLSWTEPLFGERPRLHKIAALLALGLSVPAAWLLRRAVERALAFARHGGGPVLWRGVSGVGAIGGGLSLLLVEPRLWSAQRHRAFALCLGLCLLVLLVAHLRVSAARRAGVTAPAWPRAWPSAWLAPTVLLAGAMQLFVLPPRLGAFSLLLAGLVTLFGRAIAAWTPWRGGVLPWASGGAALLALLTVYEISLRATAPIENGRWGELPALAIHESRTYGLRESVQVRLRYNQYDYLLRTNSLGLPGPEIRPRPTTDTLRVLAIGDAFTMPEGVPYEQSYPVLLERRLRRCLAPRPVQVINAGVTGYGPVEEAAQLRELLPQLRPDVVVYEFFVNEFAEVAMGREERLRDIGLIEDPEPLTHAVVHRSQLLAHTLRAEERLAERLRGRPGAWRYSMALLSYYRKGGGALYGPERLRLLEGRLREMKAACDAAGARLLIYFVPGAVAVMPEAALAYYPAGEDLQDPARYDLGQPLAALREVTDGLGIPVHDVTPDLRRSARQPVYFSSSWHFSPTGHEVMAETIATTLGAGIERGGPCVAGSSW